MWPVSVTCSSVVAGQLHVSRRLFILMKQQDEETLTKGEVQLILAHFPSMRNTKKCPSFRNAIENIIVLSSWYAHYVCTNSCGHICDASAISTIHAQKSQIMSKILTVFYTNHGKHDTLTEPERVFEKAIDWRAYHQRIIITDLDS